MSSKQGCILFKSLSSFLDLLSLSQIIKDATRVSARSSSTIDLLLVLDTCTDKVSQSGVIDIGISDHCLIFCARKVIKHVFNKHNTVKIRSMRDYSKEAFQTNLLNANCNSVMTLDNVVDAWSKFKTVFLSIMNNMSPIKEV